MIGPFLHQFFAPAQTPASFCQRGSFMLTEKNFQNKVLTCILPAISKLLRIDDSE